MNEPFITINDKKVELPRGVYTEMNADLILLAGHIFHSLEIPGEFLKRKLNASEEDRKTILFELENAEDWLFSAIKTIGELISSADRDIFEDRTLSHVGYLVSTLTYLLESVGNTRKIVTHCTVEDQEASETIEKVENQ